MRVADTSALFAFFSSDDAHHAAAVKLVAQDDPILVPSEILVETIDLVAYRFGHAAAKKALADLLGLPHVTIPPRCAIEPVQAIHADSRGGLSLADAFVVQACRERGATALSFDRRLVRASKG